MSLAKPTNIGLRLHAAGWKSGSVLTADHAKTIEQLLQRGGHPPYSLLFGEFLVVVSQTCDIVAPKLEAEPYVEVLLLRERGAIDSTKSGLRTTRYISFQAYANGPIYEAHATDRFWVPRELFEGYTPDRDRFLDSKATKRLSIWLGLRYTRPAWPQELVSRLPKTAAIEKILRDVSEAVAEIHVAISDVDRELPANKPYRLTIYGVMDTDEFQNNRNSREKCTEAFFKLIDLLNKCPGIFVEEESDLLPGDEFNWQIARMTDLWNLANLTEAAEDTQDG